MFFSKGNYEKPKSLRNGLEVNKTAQSNAINLLHIIVTGVNILPHVTKDYH